MLFRSVMVNGTHIDTSSIRVVNVPNVHITDNRFIYTYVKTTSGENTALINVDTPENAVIRNNVLIATSLIEPTTGRYPLRFIHVFGEKIVVSENIVDDETGLGEVIGITIDSRGSGGNIDIDIDSKDIMILNNYFKDGGLCVPGIPDGIDNIMIHHNRHFS